MRRANRWTISLQGRQRPGHDHPHRPRHDPTAVAYTSTAPHEVATDRDRSTDPQRQGVREGMSTQAIPPGSSPSARESGLDRRPHDASPQNTRGCARTRTALSRSSTRTRPRKGSRADVEKKIQAIRGDAAIKIAAAELEQATALRTIKDCGETVASIAEATELSAAEVRKLLKLAPASSTPRYEPTPAKLDPEDLPPAALAG